MVTIGANAAPPPPPPPPPPSEVKNVTDALSNNYAKTQKALAAYKKIEADLIGKQAQLDALEGKPVSAADEKMNDSTKNEIEKLKAAIEADKKTLQTRGNSLKSAYGALSANLRKFSKEIEVKLEAWQQGIVTEQKTEVGSAKKVRAPKQDVDYMDELMNKLKKLRGDEE